MDKRGQGLSVTAIILIVLGILVLVMLIIGFMYGWDKIMPWIKPSNNVADVAQACSLACSTGAKFAYCSESRELNDGTDVLKDVNCNFLNKIKTKYGIEPCAAISCDSVPIEGNVADCTVNAGKTVDYLDVNNELQEEACP